MKPPASLGNTTVPGVSLTSSLMSTPSASRKGPSALFDRPTMIWYVLSYDPQHQNQFTNRKK
jgi:hypothetical protein